MDGDTVAGFGLHFHDLGEHDQGVPDAWHLYRLRAPRGRSASFSSERVPALAYLALGTAPWV